MFHAWANLVLPLRCTEMMSSPLLRSEGTEEYLFRLDLDSGISLQNVLELGPELPLFGVCMGLQCMGEAHGGKIVRSPYGIMHRKSSLVYYDKKGEVGLLAGLPNFPSDKLEITVWTEDGLIMAVRHKEYKNMQRKLFHVYIFYLVNIRMHQMSLFDSCTHIA
ncbi:hypothetical protein AMTRI_Chr04g181560 [Amborella trichopoda]